MTVALSRHASHRSCAVLLALAACQVVPAPVVPVTVVVQPPAQSACEEERVLIDDELDVFFDAGGSDG